jgi:hypothetical protein
MAIDLRDAIVAGNRTFPPGGWLDCTTDLGTFTSSGYNLVGAGTGCPSAGPGDLLVAPQDVSTQVLHPLADNGGPQIVYGAPFTHALREGSIALDSGVCADALGVGVPTDPARPPPSGRRRV